MRWNNLSGDEIFEAMERIGLSKVASEDSADDEAIVSALEELDAAAQSFEAAGLVRQARQVSELMTVVAAKKKPPVKNKPAKKGVSEEAKKVLRMFGFSDKDLEGHETDSDNLK
jgi:hypothetical protein